MHPQQIREHLIKTGVKNLKEYGYPKCTPENILTDSIYKAFFLSMLHDNHGLSNIKVDAVIDELIKEIDG